MHHLTHDLLLHIAGLKWEHSHGTHANKVRQWQDAGCPDLAIDDPSNDPHNDDGCGGLYTELVDTLRMYVECETITPVQAAKVLVTFYEFHIDRCHKTCGGG